MGDPLSVAASIAGLLGLAQQLAQGVYGCYKYCKSLRDARGQIQEVIHQLNLLRTQLQDLERVFASTSEPLASRGNVLSTVKDCSTDIVHFCSLLDPSFNGLKGRLQQLKWPTKKEEVSSFLAKLRGYQAIFESAKTSDILRLTDMTLSLEKQTIQNLEVERNRAAEVRQKEAWRDFLSWLCPLDLKELENLQKHIHESRRAQSPWILKETRFKSWRDSKRGHLWCYGDPGVGKTVLISVIIHHLLKWESKRPGFHLAYFYCNFQAERIQSAEYVIGFLLKQLISKSYNLESLPSTIQRIYEREKEHHVSMRILKPLMTGVLSSLHSVHIVIDGLDELSLEAQSTIVDFLNDPGGGRISNSPKVLLSSRPHLQGLRFMEKLEIRAREEDLKALIRHRMKTDPGIKQVVGADSTWAGRTTGWILRRSHGLPLLAELYLTGIAEESSKADIEDKIRSFKTGLLDQYDQTLIRIRANPAFAKVAFRTFSWLMAAHRPLSKDELCEALGIGLEDKTLRKDRIPPFELVLKSCMGLVRFNTPLKTMEFFHFSIREHLIARGRPEEIASANVPKGCLRYLRFEEFSSLCLDEQSLVHRRNRYPLASYLAENWDAHVRGDAEIGLSDQVYELLGSLNIFSSLQLLPDSVRNVRLIGSVTDMHTCRAPSKEMALYLCTYFSLTKVLQTAFSKELSAGIPVSWGSRYSPSHVAVCYGDATLLQEILAHPNSKEIQDKWGLTPLHLTLSLQSTEEVELVKTLLQHAPNLELEDQDKDTALQIATTYATFESTELLLKAGAKVNVQDRWKRTPLHRAIQRGSLRITQMLLDYGANPTITDVDSISPLRLCLQNRQPMLVYAVMNARDNERKEYDFDPMERIAGDGFLQFKADTIQSEREKLDRLERGRQECEHRLRTRTCRTITELEWASTKGDSRIAELAQASADINQQNPIAKKTALYCAIENNRLEAVFWLADAGAALDIRDSDGKTPLDYAQGSNLIDIEWMLHYAGVLARPNDSRPSERVRECFRDRFWRIRLHRGKRCYPEEERLLGRRKKLERDGEIVQPDGVTEHFKDSTQR